MSDYLSSEQVAKLLEPINARRVSHRDNQSHLEAYDVRAHLCRIFGFGRWSADVLDITPLYEEITGEGNIRRVYCGYRATLRLAVHAPDGTPLATYTECATGDASNFPITKRADAHDFAIKTAESQALKRCAINLGDQYGLSLYRAGSTEAVVVKTWVLPKVAPDLTRSAASDLAAFTEPEVVPETVLADPEPDDAGRTADRIRGDALARDRKSVV